MLSPHERICIRNLLVKWINLNILDYNAGNDIFHILDLLDLSNREYTVKKCIIDKSEYRQLKKSKRKNVKYVFTKKDVFKYVNNDFGVLLINCDNKKIDISKFKKYKGLILLYNLHNKFYNNSNYIIGSFISGNVYECQIV